MSERPAWILVVDDDPVNRTMLTRLLEQEGYRVDTAADGRRALEMLNADRFDVVLLDLLMPEMDGYEVLVRMKEDDVLCHLPVFMITALDAVESAARCIEAGADDYLPKPFDPVVLRARVKAGLSKKRLHDLEAEHLAEMARLNRRLEARIEEQMAELVRTGELKRFLPQQVADGLLAGELDKGAERRRITVLFADMVGFTNLSETLEPEELAQMLNEYLREMTAVAVSESGTLIDFAGDGVFVIYGAPGAAREEEQAVQAIRTGLGMRDRVGALAAVLRSRGVAVPADLQIRVGVNSGHCTLGVFGSDVMRAYKAVGFPVNVAARLQGAAAPGSILCGFRTYALIEDRVRAVRREPLTVKGATHPVEAWEILELVDRDGRLATGAQATG